MPSKYQATSTANYEGCYHTDHTVPTVYFRPDAERPSKALPLLLDLTYLFAGDVGNPAHETMGKGVQLSGSRRPKATELGKHRRLAPAEIRLADFPELRAAIQEGA